MLFSVIYSPAIRFIHLYFSVTTLYVMDSQLNIAKPVTTILAVSVFLMKGLVIKRSEFRFDCQRLLSFLNMTDNLCINVERLADCYYLFRNLRTNINFHTVSHVEDLVHFLPISSAFIMNHLEERRHREHVVLYDATVVIHEMKHLCLRSTCTVYHTMNLRTELVKHLLYHRCISACRRKHELSGINSKSFYCISEFLCTGINKFVRNFLVIGLRIFLRKIF